MRFVKLIAAAALACSGLAGQAQAAKVFTTSGTITPDQYGTSSWYSDLALPESTTPSWTRGFTIRFAAPFSGVVTWWPSGWYSRTDPYGNEWANDLVEIPTEMTAQKSFAFSWPSPIQRNNGWTYREYFLGAGVAIDSSEQVNHVDFTVSGFAAVPEPATWALMILGFGAVGAAMRRRPVTRHAYVEPKFEQA